MVNRHGTQHSVRVLFGPMRRTLFSLVALYVCLVAAPGGASASDDGLRWNAFTVNAYLDDEAALHVRERHAIVFTGDMNGAERVFGLRAGESLTLVGVSRVDSSTGALRPLVPGDLDQVDHYEYSQSAISVRWRSRLPSAPAFAETEIVYVIDYVLHGVVQPTGDSLRLAHDFGFGRPSKIGTVDVQLSAAATWRAQAPLGSALERRNLPANEPILLDVSFDVPERAKLHRTVVIAFLLITPLALLILWYVHERRRGRLAPIEHAAAHDLEQHLRRWKPELAAVLWATLTGPGRNAVAALLARMVLEHKISVHGESLKLDIDRKELDGYERELVDGVFFADETSCLSALRLHYREHGFNPRACLARLAAERDRLLGPVGLRPRLLGSAFAVWAVGAIVSLAAPGEAAVRTAVTCAMSLPPVLLAAGLAARWRSRLDLNEDAAVGFLLPALVPPLGAALYIWLYGGLTVLADWGVALMAVGFCAGVFALAAGSQTRAGLQLGRTLAACRTALARALRRRHELPDVLTPYLVAFDLFEGAEASRHNGTWVQVLRRIAAGVATPWARPTPDSFSPRAHLASSHD